MTRISVIIPYYQREQGILRRALDTVYAQDLSGRDVQVDILIVDDESPSPPELELDGLNRDGFSIRVLRRPNGGPAQARNTGLDAATGADYVAFLDSDDLWRPAHLATGLSLLEKGAQIYFCDSLYSETETWFSGLDCIDRLVAASDLQGDALYLISKKKILPLFIESCLAHTSTVIFDYAAIPDVRFDASQLTAGEDYLFWLCVLQQTDMAAYSTHILSDRGRGIDLYRSALDWNNPECVKRLYYALRLHQKIKHQYCETQEQKRHVGEKITLLRRGIAYLFMRNFLRHPRSNAWVLSRLVIHDFPSFLLLPANMLITARQKLAGKVDFPIG
ncbi:glycosyltransferase family 2 protein [Hyphomonas sp.]|uniref:glycosyltransferase family 2 protein n=1 Tax=Hyphomonas sp. TaxID=87 RepID=UPI0030FA202D